MTQIHIYEKQLEKAHKGKKKTKNNNKTNAPKPFLLPEILT